MALIQPRTAPGTLELLPREQQIFQQMIDTIRRGYERFGFVPIETPVFEMKDVLLTKSGGETEKQVYFVQSTGSLQQGHEAEMVLRFDLTVPLARYVAEHEHNLAFPFRRYQIQRVYRGERAQRGRFREFYQCDIDVIGKDKLDPAYDAEIPAIIVQIFEELKIGDFTIHFSNRKILLGLLNGYGVTDAEKQKLILREVDKLDKIGREKVHAAIVALGLSAAHADQILNLITNKGSNEEILTALRGQNCN
ncbi:MAG TPA: HisS family protein, partial [Alphaproteobacteria bacterium]|nr:HisS family protein [Alphaproteobacteria bacterium]